MTRAAVPLLALALSWGAVAGAQDDPFDLGLRASAEGRHGEAAAVFHGLAEAGDARAAYNLAVLFATGRGLPKNETEALFWAWRARLEGLPQAQALVARLQPGAGPDRIEQIVARLEAWARPRAEAGQDAAILQLAAILGHARPEPDLSAAFAWAALAAALDIGGAVAARDSYWAGIDPAERSAAQDAAMGLMRDWCAGQAIGAQPTVCGVIAAMAPTG